MKIFEIISTLNAGGAARFVTDLSNELCKNNNVTIIVLYPFKSDSIYSSELANNIRIISMDKKKGLDMNLFFRIKSLIDLEKPDIVHTHLTGIIYSLFSYWKHSSTKFIHTIHSDAVYDATGCMGKVIRKFAFSNNRVHAITISEESQKSFVNYYGLSSTMIPNGRPRYTNPNMLCLRNIEKELFEIKTNKDACIITNVARLNKVKNQYILAKAINHLNEQGYHIEMINIGGIDHLEVKNSISNLNSPYIHLLGSRSNPRDYVYLSDAFVLSSKIEGMPITLIESFSVGTIPICTPVGGIKNMIVDEKNGFLANGTTQKDIEEVLIRFMTMSKEKLREIKNESLNSFQLYDIKVCASNYTNLMKSLKCTH